MTTEAWIVSCRQQGDPELDVGPRYLDHECKVVRGMCNARMFPSALAASAALVAAQLRGSDVNAWSIAMLREEDVLRICSVRLRRQATKMFGLRATTPAAIVADRYEDAGMMDEANLLRRKT